MNTSFFRLIGFLVLILLFNSFSLYINAENIRPKEFSNEKMSWQETLNSTRFIAYTPAPPFNPLPNMTVPAKDKYIRRDLKKVRKYFDGIILYSTNPTLGGDKIIPIAKSLGFRSVILGIWDVKSDKEIDTAINLTRKFPELIPAICVGNEGLTFHHNYTFDELTKCIEKIKISLPNIGISTSEPVYAYFARADLRAVGDFIMPNIHSFWANIPNPTPEQAVEWTLYQAEQLKKISNDSKLIFVKESGWPSGGNPICSPEFQKQFWKILFQRSKEKNNVLWCAFESFDLPWKSDNGQSVESRWGFWTSKRVPKPVLSIMKSGEDE